MNPTCNTRSAADFSPQFSVRQDSLRPAQLVVKKVTISSIYMYSDLIV